MNVLDLAGLLTLLSGYILGLGAVTVIDTLGFLGRRSGYWTEATIRTHKVTKPLIWFGMLLVLMGGLVFFRERLLLGTHLLLFVLSCVLIVNGLFLSLRISPFLLKWEKAGHSAHLLPQPLQRQIALSLIFSDFGWWGSLAILVVDLVQQMNTV